MPMVPELPVALPRPAPASGPSTAWCSAASAPSIVDRVQDAGSSGASPPTAAGAAARASPLKPAVDEALADLPTYRRGRGLRRRRRRAHGGGPRCLVARTDGRPSGRVARAEPMDCEDPLFLLYTCGTTGKPKGIVHTTGGYLAQVAYTSRSTSSTCSRRGHLLVHRRHRLDHRAQLHRLRAACQRCHAVIYEGAPDTPRQGPVLGHRRALRRNPALHRAHRHPHVHEVGGRGAREARPVVAAAARHRRRAHQPRGVDVVPHPHRWRPLPDRRHVVADRDRRPHDHPAAGRHRPQAGLGHRPAARHRVEVVDDDGTPIEKGGGYLTITRPWPAMLRGIWGDPERYFDTYWSTYPGRYFAGDGAQLDDDGYLWLLGRVDDVMNVSGHRVSTTEVESALVDHPAVAEAAVVGRQRRHHRPGHRRLRHRPQHRRAEPRADRGDPPARRQQDRPDRPTQARHHRPRPPQDPQRQDHAPAAARRRRGPRPRRHHHPRRRLAWWTPSAPGGRGAREQPVTDLTVADNWQWHDGPVEPGPRWCSTWTASCPTRPDASTTSSGPTATGRRSSQACGDDAAHRRGGAAARGARSRPADRAAHRPPASGSATRRWRGSSATSCGGTC